jgi:hypothetical protein
MKPATCSGVISGSARAVAHQHARLRFPFRRIGRERAVEADHSFQIRAGHRRAEHDPTAETITDRRDVRGVDAFVGLEHVVARHEAVRAQLFAAAHFGRPFAGLVGVLGDLSIAEHVDGERDVSASASIWARFFTPSFSPHHWCTTTTPGRLSFAASSNAIHPFNVVLPCL